MYSSFNYELIKISEEKSFKEKAKTFIKVVGPAAIGVGVGSALGDQLGHMLDTRVTNPKIKAMARAGLLIGTPIITSAVLPQVREEWQKLMSKARGKNGPSV